MRELEKAFAQCGILAIACAVLMLLLALAGCATTNSRDRALIAAGQAAASLPTMGDSEMACAGEPRAPAPKGAARVRESQVTNYILDLREAGADCRDKLGVVRRVWRKVEDVRSRAVPPVVKGESK